LSSQRNIRPNQIAAITALLHGGTQTDAAKAASVSRRTIRNWLNDSNFQQALAEAEAQALATAARLLAGASASAVKTLVAVMRDSDNAAERRRAASDLLRIVGPFRLDASIERRIAELERRLIHEQNAD
jgi:hypothetical protein